MIHYLPRTLLQLFFILISLQGFAGHHLVQCKQGEADLAEVNFQEEYARLDGEWEFYYNALFSPDQLDTMEAESFGQIPGFWKHYEGNLSKFGFATYKLTFHLTKSQLDQSLSIRVANIHNAYKVWFNGKLIAEVGEVGKSYENSIPRWLPLSAKLEGLDLNNEIVIQVCNYRHRNGGIQDVVEIGSTESFEADYRHQYFSEVFLSGAAFILGCFFIGMFFFWKKDKAAMYFGIFSIFFSFRIMLVGTRSIGYTFEDLPWDLLVRGEYIGMFMMHFFMFGFVYHAFRNQTNKLYAQVLKFYTLLLVLICLIPGDFFTYVTIPNNYFLLLTFVYTVIIFIKGVKANVPGAIWAILAMAIFFFTTIPVIFWKRTI